MHSFIGIVLSGKENYHEWFRKVKNTLIFNDLWDDVCESKMKITMNGFKKLKILLFLMICGMMFVKAK